MAMMAKMRSLAPAFIITVGALFVLFMIISDSNVLEALGGRSNDVGSVNGVDISYQEYARAIDVQIQNQKSQTGEDIPEESMDQLREQVWDAVVTQTLISKEIEKFGISVSDDEVRDIILGNNPPEFLKRNFVDSTGNFNRQLYEGALFDPRNKEALLQAEEVVRQNRLSEKLQSLLLASITVSEAEIKNKFIDQNTKLNVEYALVDVSQFPDSAIKVTDDELKEFYNKNLDLHQIHPQRKLKYVLFSNKASSEDSATIINNLENIASKLKTDTTSFKETVEIYSSLPYSKDTLTLSAIPETAAPLISKAPTGSIVGPVATTEGFVLYKVAAVVPSNELLVKASHILINQYGSDEKNYEEAMKIYNQLISGGNFAQIAKEKSADPGSGSKGGDLGWFGKGAMVPEFEKAAFSGEVGVVQKPIKSGYGYHIVKVTDKSNSKYVIEKIVSPIKPSASTVDANLNAAQDFTYLATEKSGFENEAKLMNYQVMETTPFLEETFSIPGIGTNKRIVDFAFKNSVNTVSDPFKVQNGYVVVMVSETIKEGVKPFEEVKDLVKPNLIREKKFQKAKTLAEDLKKKINGDLSKVTGINSKVIVATTGSFTPGGTVPGIGRDYAFIENAKDLELNKISEPVKGMRGYYLLKVLEKSNFDSTAYDAQRIMIRDGILQEKKSMYFNQWLMKIKKDADIVDNRHLFFGQ
jgi:parvulin-like peptidyl-prolyl isomerase